VLILSQQVVVVVVAMLSHQVEVQPFQVLQMRERMEQVALEVEVVLRRLEVLVERLIQEEQVHWVKEGLVEVTGRMVEVEEVDTMVEVVAQDQPVEASVVGVEVVVLPTQRIFSSFLDKVSLVLILLMEMLLPIHRHPIILE
jgi:hypothetical protein